MARPPGKTSQSPLRRAPGANPADGAADRPAAGPLDRATLRALDLAHVWHPYTQMADHAEDDFPIIERAEGRRLYDVDGTAYWDGVASIWLSTHGHRVPEIDAAVRAQLDQVAHATLLGQANVPSIQLAARLAAVAPQGLHRVFYSDNGSTAVESAIKMALQYWHLQGQTGKADILSFDGGYHGDTLGCITAAYVPAFHAPFRAAIPQPASQLPYPDTFRGKPDPDDERDACLETADRVLAQRADRTAAIVVEPMVQGVGGIRVMPKGYLRGLRALCNEHDVLLVADEVATGFGRTGQLFACNHEGVAPDLMALGKGISGGYLPLAATLATDAIYEAFLAPYEEGKQFFHGHSYTGNPLACAAGLASLELLEKQLPAARKTATWLHEEMQSFRRHDGVGDVRGLGFMWGMDLCAPDRTPFPYAARSGWRVAKRARARGLLVRPYGHIALFLPPITTPQSELQTILELYHQAFDDARGELNALAQAGSAQPAQKHAPTTRPAAKDSPPRAARS